LDPLVQEIIELDKGLNITNIKVRARLLCVACDVPAARKIGGFLSFSACYGCSKCLKLFPRKEAGDFTFPF
jgi:hypothetical protein